MATAKVEGILLNNDNIRKEMLKRVYWEDKQYTDFSNGDFVRNISVNTHEVSPVSEGRDLLTYTYNSDSEFSKETLKRYMSNGVNHDIYKVDQIPYEGRFKWDGDYLENFSEDNMRLLVSNIKLADADKENTYANQKRLLGEKRLTPALEDFYGSKTAAMLSVLQNSAHGKVNSFVGLGTGRMADIPETENAKIIDDFLDAPVNASINVETKKPWFTRWYQKNKTKVKSYNVYQGAGFKYLWEQLSKAIDNDKFNRYVEYISVNNSDFEELSDYYYTNKRGIISNYDDFSQNTFTVVKGGGSVQQIYSEGDNAGSNYWIVNEKDENGDEVEKQVNSISTDSYETYEVITEKGKEKSLLAKTNKLFNQHKISTLVGRFHTTTTEYGIDKGPTTIDSAVRPGFGNSHGRNLLTKDAENGDVKKTHGYENPYCRVWTYHHQYDQVSKLIRPFTKKDKNNNIIDPRSYNPYSTNYVTFTTENKKVESKVNSDLDGISYLKRNTVLGKNGFVNIAPKKEYCETDGSSSVEIKKCMFSIENLAWKDVPRRGYGDLEQYYISDEQRGPNGGRIMWFPPYGLNFQESVSVEWAQNKFIGRGEPVFTYSNTNRNGVLNFDILVDHPSIIDNIPKNNLKEDILTDDDILRFFAGCDIPEAFNKKENCPEEIVEKNNGKEKNESQVVNKEKCRQIKFSVYFPNNYSGNGASKPKKENLETPTDKAWYRYLLFGRNAKIPENESDVGNGYEMKVMLTTGITSNPVIKSEGLDVYKNPSEQKGKYKDLKYYYRVDWDLHQVLKYGIYSDDTSYSLNHPLIAEENSGIIKCGFSHIIAALFDAKKDEIDKDKIIQEHINELRCTEEKEKILFDEIVDVLKNEAKIKKIEIIGVASPQDSGHTDDLATRRAKTTKTLFTYLNDDLIFISSAQTTDEEGKSKGYNAKNNNVEGTKYFKRADVIISYNAPEIIPFAKTTNEIQNNSDDTKRTEKPSEYNEIIKTSGPERYETEAEYFRNIKDTDPLIHKKIVEKFKYFNPAFHSISPEGFNARLTFLQQCTRQGHTIEASDLNGFAKTAGNLSFGRMPVCVLRLGDFINTKIIINGMSINYDSSGGAMQWDLNPEGIGVQPMYAKVSLQITILGGQSLDGPINRLQNAVTFNYYANTGVYDNRSDRIQVNSGLSATEIVGRKNDTIDDSQYYQSSLLYRHVFTPLPNRKPATNEEMNENKQKNQN